MPVTVTYPGVYLEELPSGNHTVTPVATSIAAFVGRAPTGPVDTPTTIFNFGDYARFYGGLSHDYPMSYAVQDFFANGGAQAIICRLFEPTALSDGYAMMRFTDTPPPLPVNWVIDANVTAGATKMAVNTSENAEGEPDVGQTFFVNGDRSQQYTVTAYAPGDPTKKTANTMSFVPGLAKAFNKCTAMQFKAAPQPNGWIVASASQGKVTLLGGSGIPELGDVLTFGSDATPYAIISEPVVSGTDPSALSVQMTVAPAPTSIILYGTVANVGPPQPLPMPQGWQSDAFTQGGTPTTGNVTLINGTGAPLAGDQFTLGSKPRVYVVTKFYPPGKGPASIDFKSLDGLPLDPEGCHCCSPAFIRPPPQGWVPRAPKLGATSTTVTLGPGGSGVVDVGCTFSAPGDPDGPYVVRYVDPSSGTIYFLPEASSALAQATSIALKPPLTLSAANPGAWGNQLVAQADTLGISTATVKQFAEYGLTTDDLFNLTVKRVNARGQAVGAPERYINVSVRSDGAAASFPNRLDRVLKEQSLLARVANLSDLPPGPGSAAAGVGGDDGTFLEMGTYIGDPDQKTGIYLLEHASLFNLLCIPPDQRITDDVDNDLPSPVKQAAAEYCTDRRALFIVDPPVDWMHKAKQGQLSQIDPDSVGITGENAAGIEVATSAAVYFPRVKRIDTLTNAQAVFAPCGMVAGVMAATDVRRGVWKAPAGIDCGLAGVTALEVNLTDQENGQLNPLGINCLRSFPIVGPVVWGSRTLRGADAFDDDYKYVPVRRLTLFIENSLMQATQWAVFEPNDEALWSSLRLMVSSFLAGLSRQGAFYSYAVTCDGTTTSQDDVANGVVNIKVQIAPVKPAEFVVIQIQQTAGGASPS